MPGLPNQSLPTDPPAGGEGGQAGVTQPTGSESRVSDAAQSMADIISAGMQSEIQQDEAAAAAAAAGGVEGAPVPDEEGFIEVDLTDVEQRLLEHGVVLDLVTAEVPEDRRDKYAALLESVLATVEGAEGRVEEAEDYASRVRQFGDRLENNPDLVLLSVAASNPGAFKKAVDLFEQMESDPTVRASVMDRLATEAQKADLDRREAGLTRREKMAKSRAITARVKRLAAQNNVDFSLAERMVAMAIQANGGDIELTKVDDVVTGLKPVSPAKTRRIRTPEAQKLAKGAPNASVAGAGGAAPSDGAGAGGAGGSPGLTEVSRTRRRGGGIFRSIVSEASRRLNSAGAE